ncbi:MAG: carbohydrate ABC transporter permease [Treponema sp.]|jgi:ABC-type glycerol-3-phosphate transport system permease component|nr:carbohydrate ABC transporter permease [Treponema sp.]
MPSAYSGNKGPAGLLRRGLPNMFGGLFLVLTALAVLVPFVWMILTSVQPNNKSVMSRPYHIPWPPVFQNYINAWKAEPFDVYTFNSFFTATTIMLLQGISSLMAGYVFTFLKIPGRKFLFFMVLAVLMMPAQIAIIPLYTTMVNLGWLDTYKALIVPFIADAYGIFLLKQHLGSLPMDFYEAARMEGAGHLRITFHIMAHLVKPSLIAYGIMAFKWRWNDYFWVLIMTSSTNKRTMPVGLVMMKAVEGVTQWHLLMAATMIVIGPIIVIYLFMQKYIKNDYLAGGIKG